MSIEKLKLVMQYLWEKKDQRNIVLLKQVRLAIYQCIGTDKRTIKHSIKVILEIGWLKRLNRHQFKITEEHITEDF